MAITKEATKQEKEELEVAKAEQKAQAEAEIRQASVYNVHQIIRSIALDNQFGNDGRQPGSVIDAYLSEYLNSGYKLVSTHYLGRVFFEGGAQPIAESVLYVLLREG